MKYKGILTVLTSSLAVSTRPQSVQWDGSGLHLYITKTGGKSWVQRITVDGRRRDIGLGGYPAVTLAQARKRALENKQTIADGRDPLAVNQEEETQEALPYVRRGRAYRLRTAPAQSQERAVRGASHCAYLPTSSRTSCLTW